jgi:hypothetical protein
MKDALAVLGLVGAALFNLASRCRRPLLRPVFARASAFSSNFGLNPISARALILSAIVASFHDGISHNVERHPPVPLACNQQRIAALA